MEAIDGGKNTSKDFLSKEGVARASPSLHFPASRAQCGPGRADPRFSSDSVDAGIESIPISAFDRFIQSELVVEKHTGSTRWLLLLPP